MHDEPGCTHAGVFANERSMHCTTAGWHVRCDCATNQEIQCASCRMSWETGTWVFPLLGEFTVVTCGAIRGEFERHRRVVFTAKRQRHILNATMLFYPIHTLPHPKLIHGIVLGLIDQSQPVISRSGANDHCTKSS
jgi:hypothetical protein